MIVVDELQDLLKDDDFREDLKRELVDQLDSKHLDLWHEIDVGSTWTADLSFSFTPALAR